MKKNLKFIFSFIVLLAILLISKKVDANSISSISMDIYVDNAGDAHVTEQWVCNTSSGTEVYHPYYNLGNSVISDLSVVDNGTTYSTLSSWNTSGTLSSKAYKCGINKISNGVELCWGISEYGKHTYTVTYKISNFVADLNDSQMIYWTLIPYEFSNTIGNAYIKIHTDFNVPSTTDVWGYGNYGGTAYVYDGYIEMQSDGSLASSEYMTILVKFPSNTFQVSDNHIDRNFDYYYNMSQEGATAYKDKESTSFTFSFAFDIIFSVIVFLFCLIPFGFAAKTMKTLSFNIDKESKRLVKDAPYFRDIPCNKNLYVAYCIATKYGLSKNKTDLLGAIILKWLKNGIVKVEKRESGKIFKKEDSVIILNSDFFRGYASIGETFDDELLSKEKTLYKMLYDASIDGILENKEFEKWCSSHYSKILDWFDDISDIVEKKLIEDGLIKTEETKTLGLFKTKSKYATSELTQLAVELSGLKKYLNDYTLISDREAIEVTLFEDYLIYAQMLGIADKVAKEFKELYPDMIEQSNFYSYDYILFINYCSHNGISSASAARSRANSYSAGGGGFSSGGGGGGSFGGGGGGGGFR